jgi:hypothetical protein
MRTHKHWLYFWWAILQHFGRECKKTWGGEVIAVAVGGIAGAATSYLRTHGQTSFTDALIDGLITAVLFFAIYIFVHLIRSPWLERVSEGMAPSLLDGILGGGLLLSLICGAILVCHLLAQDWRSELTLHAPADVGGKKSQSIIAYEECKAQVAALTPFQEPANSLRRRTIKLADELNRFWAVNPIPGFPNSQATTPEKSKEIQDYWATHETIYNTKYKDLILGILREYQQKGISVGWLDRAAENHMFGASPFSAPACFQDELCQFKELAFHVDARGNKIEF